MILSPKQTYALDLLQDNSTQELLYGGGAGGGTGSSTANGGAGGGLIGGNATSYASGLGYEAKGGAQVFTNNRGTYPSPGGNTATDGQLGIGGNGDTGIIIEI